MKQAPGRLLFVRRPEVWLENTPCSEELVVGGTTDVLGLMPPGKLEGLGNCHIARTVYLQHAGIHGIASLGAALANLRSAFFAGFCLVGTFV